MTNLNAQTFEIAVTVNVSATSEEEARAIAYDLLLSGRQDRIVDDPDDQISSAATLDGLFENEPMANLDGLFEKAGIE